MKEKTAINADNLPLSVREHLMRSQYQRAVATLCQEAEIDKQQAQQLIESYRQNLREENLALEIRIMNERQQKEEQKRQQMNIIMGLRVLLGLGFLVLVYLSLKAIA